MVAPRSALSVKGQYLLIAAGIAAGLVSLRFVLLGAWPVLVFSLLDIGALAVALYVFNKSPVPQERLRVLDGEIELIRSDSRGRQTRITLPAFWTRLEMSGRSEVDATSGSPFANSAIQSGNASVQRNVADLPPKSAPR